MRAPETKLIYDSAQPCASLGVRAVITAGRSLVFRSDELIVEVMVHAGRDAWGYHYGQVSRHADGTPVVGTLVGLDNGDPVTTDECGQFAVATSNARAARELRIYTDEGVRSFSIPQ